MEVCNLVVYHDTDASIHLKSLLDFQAMIIFDESLYDYSSYDDGESDDVLYDGHGFYLYLA